MKERRYIMFFHVIIHVHVVLSSSLDRARHKGIPNLVSDKNEVVYLTSTDLNGSQRILVRPRALIRALESKGVKDAGFQPRFGVLAFGTSFP
jgi:hypothetical protein